MYTRGQLALIGNVGRKAIRLYEQEGLISACKINPENGYHYYNYEQIKRLHRIKDYKKLSFTLADIKDILCNGVSEKEIINEKKVELDYDIKSMQDLRKNLELLNINSGLEQNSLQIMSPLIDHKYFKSCNCLCIEENVELEKLGISVGKLYEQATKYHLIVEGAHFVKYEGLLEDDADFKMTTCLPVLILDKCEIDQDNIYIQNNVECLHMNFTGGFSKVGNAHKLIKDYMDQNNIVGNGIVYEVYNRDLSVEIYYELNK